MQKLFSKFFFFENQPNCNRIFFEIHKNCQHYFNNFFRIFFFEKFSFGQNFYYRIFFGENFVVHKNISAKIFFTIFSRICFVFDVCGIMYFAKFFIRNFAYCEFFCFAILMYDKKIVNFFCVFFSAMNVNTKFKNVSFLKKSKIFSDRTFGFLYSLLGK